MDSVQDSSPVTLNSNPESMDSSSQELPAAGVNLLATPLENPGLVLSNPELLRKLFVADIQRWDLYPIIDAKLLELLSSTKLQEVSPKLRRLQEGLHYMWSLTSSCDGSQRSALGSIFTGMWPHICFIVTAPSPFAISMAHDAWFHSETILARVFPIPGTSNSTPSGNSQTKLPSASRKKKNSVDDDGFQKPRKTVKTLVLEEVPPPPPVGNSFSPIDPGDPDMDAEESEDEDPIPPRTERPQPFFIKLDPGWRDTRQQINSLIKTNLPIRFMNEFFKILPQNMAQFREIQRFLHSKNIKCFNMNPKADRPKKIIIKGIAPDTTSEEVKSELTARGFEVIRVSQLRKYDKDTYVKRGLPLYICNIRPTDNYQEIFDISEFLGFLVKVETFKNKRAKQCYNCQKFHHSSDNCTLDPVCLKCAGEHKTSTCTKSRDTPAKCANCKGDHPANFRGCQYHPETIRARRQPVPTIKDVADANLHNVPTRPPPKVVAPLNSTTPSAMPTFSAMVTKNFSKPSPPQNSTSVQPNLDYDTVITKLEKIVHLLERVQSLCTQLNFPDASILFSHFNAIDKIIPTPASAASSQGPLKPINGP